MEIEKLVVLHKFEKYLTKHKFDKNIIVNLFAFSEYKNNVLHYIHIFFLCKAWRNFYHEIN